MSEPKRWLLTGISSGIGQALAQAALKRGDTVVGCARNPADVAKFEALAPGRSIGVQLDVSKADEIEPVIACVVAGGPLDIVVNNAGQSLFGALSLTSPHQPACAGTSYRPPHHRPD